MKTPNKSLTRPHKRDVKVGKSRSGGKEENRDAYNRLVEEYREYKRNYSRAFRFLASAVNTSFGLFLAQPFQLLEYQWWEGIFDKPTASACAPPFS